MASVNLAIVVGNLGKDPEVRFLADGKAVANITIATSESWKDKNGDKKEQTEWHRCVAYGKTAELMGEYLKKGSSVYIQGRIQTKKWTDKEGQERYTTEIVVDKMQFIGSAKASTEAPQQREPGEDLEENPF